MSRKKVAKFQIKISLFFLFLSPFTLALAPASDTPYIKTTLSEKLEVIFSEDFKSEDLLIQNRTSKIFEEYGKQFPVEFYRKNSLIFFSTKRRQTPHVITHTLPLPLTQIYPSPFPIIDQVSTSNWLTDSLVHEITHVYQLGARTRLSHWLSYIMPSYLWLVYPNIYFHDLILEGHAVLLESMYGTGGRLFSGWERALVFSQLKNDLSLRRIVNNYDDPFSKAEKYSHGGYFFSYLTEKFSLAELNAIFFFNGQNLLWPLGLYTVNRSFKKALQQDFYSLFNEYKEFYGREALKQSHSPEPVRITSRISIPINSNEEHLFFMVSDGKRPPRLVIMNKNTGKFSFKTVNMPLGKVFFIDGRYYSAGYGRTDTLSIKLSLFRDGFIPLKKYNSSFVMDVQENTVLSFDAQGGLDQFHLYLNEELLDGARSTAVMDTQGRAWYFKQKGSNRTLYRNTSPLWTYKGYYGFPVEANESGTYFLAPTLYGSGLFVYRDDEVFRLSPSDTIVSARQIDPERFLVCEINKNRFEYKVIPVKPFSDQPILYKYPFDKRDLMERADFIPSPTTSPSEETETFLNDDLLEEENIPLSSGQSFPETTEENQNIFNANEEENLLEEEQEQLILSKIEKRKSSYYNSILNLRFQEIILLWDFKDFFRSKDFQPGKWPFLYRLSFTDPLGYSFLSTQGSLSQDIRRFLTLYEYKRYRPVLQLSHQNGWWLKNEDHIRIHYFSAGLRYPLIGKENWRFSVSANGAWKTVQKNQEISNPFAVHELALNFNLNRHYPFALYAYRNINFSLIYKNEYEVNKNSFHPSYGLQWTSENELIKSFYVSTQGHWWNNRETTDIISSVLLPGKQGSWSFHSLFWNESARNFGNQIKNSLFTSIQFKKVFHQSFYPIYFPLALRRWAPFIGLSSLFSLKPIFPNPTQQQQTPVSNANPTHKSSFFHNYLLYTFIGWEMELSANHKADLALVRVGAAGGLLWKDPSKEHGTVPSFQGGIYLKAHF